MLTPTGGGCTVLGRDPARQPEAVHALAGVVTEHAQMYDTLTGLENLTFFGALFGLDAKQHKIPPSPAGGADLTHAAGQKLGAYSTGMRQRLSLAWALMHRPQVFLDEPASGLTPKVPRPSTPFFAAWPGRRVPPASCAPTSCAMPRKSAPATA